MRVKLIAALVLAGVFLSVDASANRAPTYFFRTPGNNVWCAYDDGARGPATGPATLRCDVRGGVRPLPAKPRWCTFDWGVGVRMEARGPSKVLCASDTVYEQNARVLQYGWTFRRGGFTCVARRVGLRCRNLDGHGFQLSRSRSTRF